MESKNVYICASYYHLLIAIIKKLKSDIDSDLAIIAISKNDCLIKDELLIDRLKQVGLFKNIFIYDLSYDAKGILHIYNFFKKIIETSINIKKKVYRFNEYEDVYIFHDYGIIGYILNKQKVKYNLIEDGTDCFKSYNKKVLKSFRRNWLIRKLKRLFYFYERGESKAIKSIEVNDATDLYVKDKKIIECPKKILFSSLTTQEKETIIDIFMENKDTICTEGDSLLLLTQPIDADTYGFINSEKEKVQIYYEIIKKYANNNRIIIKPHPWENTNYSEYLKNEENIEILDKNFPVEILNFFNNKFKKVITINSTAINLIDNCEEKIELGFDYIKKGVK